MFDAHQVQDGRVEVVHVHAVLDDVVAEVVGLAVGHALVDAGAGHQDREAARVVVAAVVGLREGALRVGRTTEFAAPDDERIIEQSALFEVGEQDLCVACLLFPISRALSHNGYATACDFLHQQRQVRPG